MLLLTTVGETNSTGKIWQLVYFSEICIPYTQLGLVLTRCIFKRERDRNSTLQNQKISFSLWSKEAWCRHPLVGGGWKIEERAQTTITRLCQCSGFSFQKRWKSFRLFERCGLAAASVTGTICEHDDSVSIEAFGRKANRDDNFYLREGFNIALDGKFQKKRAGPTNEVKSINLYWSKYAKPFKVTA